MINDITVLILTYNEENNIKRVLDKLSVFKKVIIVDSISQDKTTEISKSFSNVEVFTRKFDCHSNQWNFGLDQTGIKTDWVLALDADFVLSDDLINEIKNIDSSTNFSGYAINFKYCIFGKSLKGSIYPQVVALYKRDNAKYIQDGHTQRVDITGKVGTLDSIIYHDDRKPLGRWLSSQDNYMKLEADHIHDSSWGSLRHVDKLRKLIFLAPPIVLVYCLIIKSGIFDGYHGLYYALQRTLAEILLSIKLIEKKIS